MKPPADAASVWVSGPYFYLELRGHTIRLDAEEVGLKFLLLTLRHREEAPASKIGTQASPTQWDYDIVRKALEARKANAFTDTSLLDILGLEPR